MQRNGQKGLLGLGALLLVLFGFSGYLLMQKGRAAEKELVIQGTTSPGPSPGAPTVPRAASNAALPNTAPPPINTGEAPASAEVVVHVAGAVRNPGVYHLPSHSRAIDAVKQAGGGTAVANLNAVNLAALVEDGSQLYIPSRTEVVQTDASEYNHTVASSAKTTHRKSGSHGKSGKMTATGQRTLNINTASEKELEQLPGVGPAMAAKISQFRREFGPFTNPQELMLVPGLGEKKYAQMQAFVRIR